MESLGDFKPFHASFTCSCNKVFHRYYIALALPTTLNTCSIPTKQVSV